jgi:hypothetical protein
MSTPRGPEIGGQPAYATLTMVRGDEWSRVLTLRSGSATGPVIDLTGSALSCDIRKTPGGAVLSTPNLTVVSAVGGQVQITITEDMSLGLSAGAYAGDEAGVYHLTLRMSDSLQQMRTLLSVRVVLLPGGAA